MPATTPSADSVGQLLDQLDDERRIRRENCVRLLQELTPHLHAARAVQRELDRHLARRFNAFRYLRTDELGLSRIIAELLDPTAEHGQGTTYLDTMIKLLGAEVSRVPDGKIRVLQEHMLPDRRRIDIMVEFPTDDGLFCLAFENKPYAEDQPGQCSAYLRFLHSEYGDRFLLVYLPPRYWMPDESSLAAEDRERWKEHFHVLPYAADDAPRGDDDRADGEDRAAVEDAAAQDDAGAREVTAAQHQLADRAKAAARHGTSLADWFGTCCKLSDPERLRWFLREAQLYCQHHFGDSTMTDVGERYIREYLRENPKHLHAAFAVARAWPDIKHDVCRRFLEHLRDRVADEVREAFSETAGDLNIGCHYGGDKKYSTILRVYRDGWVQYEEASRFASDGRTAVMLECGFGGLTSWCWGVRSPKSKDQMTDLEKKRRQEIEAELSRNGLSRPDTGHWPYNERPRYQNWTALVPELGQELAAGGGDITTYYVDALLDIAEKAIPAINEVEGTQP